MKELNRSVIGTTTGPQTFEYTWRDCAIYALGVGAGPDEMEYLDEDGLKVIPSFGVVPYWGTFASTRRGRSRRQLTALWGWTVRAAFTWPTSSFSINPSIRWAASSPLKIPWWSFTTAAPGRARHAHRFIRL